MIRTIGRASRVGAFLAGLAIFAMMLVGAADVVGLFVFNSPLPGAFEITETLLVASVFLALALAQAKGRHIRVDVFLRLLPRPARRALDLAGQLLTAALFGLISWMSWDVAAGSLAVGEYSAGLIHFPVWPARVALALGASLMTLQTLADAAVAANLVRRPEGDNWTP